MKESKERGAMEYEHVQHTFPPVYDENSRILILGSLPSVKSREQHFYYGHKQNRFWKVMAEVLGSSVPETIEEKKKLLLANEIALWDVIAQCDIVGSSDSTIRNVTVNDIAGLLQKTHIEKIVANGGKAKQLYDKYLCQETGREIIAMPSTSPANAAWSLERLVEAYRELFV